MGIYPSYTIWSKVCCHHLSGGGGGSSTEVVAGAGHSPSWAAEESVCVPQ